MDNLYTDETTSKEKEERFKAFLYRYHDVSTNRLVQGFLSEKHHYDLFVEAVYDPSEENRQKVDQAFQQFCMEVRFVDYISKVLWRYARDYREKNMTYHKRQLEDSLKVIPWVGGRGYHFFRDVVIGKFWIQSPHF